MYYSFSACIIQVSREESPIDDRIILQIEMCQEDWMIDNGTYERVKMMQDIRDEIRYKRTGDVMIQDVSTYG